MISRRARQEQDYWLSFLDERDHAFFGHITDQDREDFFNYDSTGCPILDLVKAYSAYLRGELSLDGVMWIYRRPNPILAGKIAHGFTGEVLREARLDLCGGWPGGVALVEDYMERSCSLRPLVEWFGARSVVVWMAAWEEKSWPEVQSYKELMRQGHE